jgi:prevent-host-death family protein
MQMIETSVADAKKRFSELINRSAFSDCRVVITKRNRPVAALVSLEDLHFLQQHKKPQGLKSAIGQWEGFEEIADSIDDAVRARRSEAPGRDVSF